VSRIRAILRSVFNVLKFLNISALVLAHTIGFVAAGAVMLATG
jgi:hypothetical protein